MTFSILDGFELRDRDGCAFCFNLGRCPECEGFGNVPVMAPDGHTVVDYGACLVCRGSSLCANCCAHQVEAFEAGS